MKTYLTLVFSIFILNPSLIAQKDSTYNSQNGLCVLGGVCESLRLYNTSKTPSTDVTSQNVTANYLSASVSLYYFKIKGKHYLFQTGLEYAQTKYRIAWINNFDPQKGNFQTEYDYYDVKININAITIPAYFNLLFLKQKMYIGIGPNFDILPYSPATGYKGDYYIVDREQFSNKTNVIRVIDFGTAAKLGACLRLGKGKIALEAKVKTGIMPLFPKNWNENFFNQYFCLQIGYMFYNYQ